MPQSLRDCLAPLAAAALQTSVRAYQWGLGQKRLMRACAAMDLSESIVKQCNELLRAEEIDQYNDAMQQALALQKVKS